MWFSAFALAALAAFLAFPVNEYGDTYHYAMAIESGVARRIVEPSHLLWRPLGWLLWRLARAGFPAAGAAGPLRLFTCILSAAGVGAVAVLLRRVTTSGVAAAGAILYGLGFAYSAYATSACAYVPACALSVAGLALVWPSAGRPPSAARLAGAGALQALAILVWQPMVLHTPALALAAALAAPHGRRRSRWAPGLALFAVTTACVALGYAIAWLAVRVQVGGSLAGWLGSGTHDQAMGLSGKSIARALYGWTRLLWQPWRAALDPDARGAGKLLSPRMWLEWGLWKTAAAYLIALLFGAGVMLRRRGARSAVRVQAARRLPPGARPSVPATRMGSGAPELGWVAGLWALPHILLGISFKGGDMERWLPIWPVLVLCACAWIGREAAPGASPAPPAHWRFRARTAYFSIVLLVVGTNLVERFGIHGNIGFRPQMQLLAEAAPNLRPWDRLYLLGEFDETQLDRTVQTLWLFPWLYRTGSGPVDLATLAADEAQVEGELRKYAPSPARPGRQLISGRLLRNALQGGPAEERRRLLLERFGRGRFIRVFRAAGTQFYQFVADTASGAVVGAVQPAN